MKKIFICIILAVVLISTPAWSAVVLEAVWSDGQSKSETADQTVAFAADWSDGVSIVFVVYSAAVVGIPMAVYQQHRRKAAR